MKKVIIILLSITFFPLSKSLACSCNSDGKFFELANSSSFVALIKVSNYLTFQEINKQKTPLTMEVEIIEQYIGNEKRKKVIIWGDNGNQCRPYLSRFKIGNYYIISFFKEGPNDYYISSCGENWLNVDFKQKKVFENEKDSLKFYTFTEVKKRLKRNYKFKLTKTDYRNIYQQVLNIKELQKYFHIESDSNRKQVYITSNKEEFKDIIKGVFKFNKQVQIIRYDEKDSEKLKRSFSFYDWYIEYNKVRLEFTYNVEGILISAELKKEGDNWEVSKSTIVEL